jgi:toxoflavin synthase
VKFQGMNAKLTGVEPARRGGDPRLTPSCGPEPEMHTDYDGIAAEYKRAKQQPWRMHVEHHTLFELLGDLSGKSVLDLACGEGFLTRFIKQAGASRVLGVDLSDGMIALAREQEARSPLGIEYRVQDAGRIDLGEELFDVVTAGYLLNYASTREELLAMCESISRALKPGGRFISVNNNPAQALEHYPASRDYGFIKLAEGPLEEGTPIVYRIFLDDGPLDITNYQLSPATHQWAFETAGMRDLQWHAPRLSPTGEAQDGRDFWSSFLDLQPVIFIECRK